MLILCQEIVVISCKKHRKHINVLRTKKQNFYCSTTRLVTTRTLSGVCTVLIALKRHVKSVLHILHDSSFKSFKYMFVEPQLSRFDGKEMSSSSCLESNPYRPWRHSFQLHEFSFRIYVKNVAKLVLRGKLLHIYWYRLQLLARLPNRSPFVASCWIRLDLIRTLCQKTYGNAP